MTEQYSADDLYEVINSAFREWQKNDIVIDGEPIYDADLSMIGERQIKILWLRFGERKTYREIGEQYGITPERVRQLIIPQGFRKMRVRARKKRKEVEE